jgi:hypothetical protein
MNKKLKNFLKAAEIAVGTGIFLMDQADRVAPRMRSKLNDSIDEIRGRAKDAYDVISDRVSGISVRRNDHSGVWNVVRFAAGIGIGVGIGMLLAPAPGYETRDRISDKAQEFGDNVRQRFSSREGLHATGTGD